MAQRGGLQPVAADSQHPDVLGHRPQQLHRVPFDRGEPTPTRVPPEAGYADGGPRLGGGQAAIGE